MTHELDRRAFIRRLLTVSAAGAAWGLAGCGSRPTPDAATAIPPAEPTRTLLPDRCGPPANGACRRGSAHGHRRSESHRRPDRRTGHTDFDVFNRGRRLPGRRARRRRRPGRADPARHRCARRHRAVRQAGRERHRQAQHLQRLSWAGVRQHHESRRDRGHRRAVPGRGRQTRACDGLPLRRLAAGQLRNQRHRGRGQGCGRRDGNDEPPEVQQDRDSAGQDPAVEQHLRRHPGRGHGDQRAHRQDARLGHPDLGHEEPDGRDPGSQHAPCPGPAPVPSPISTRPSGRSSPSWMRSVS